MASDNAGGDVTQAEREAWLSRVVAATGVPAPAVEGTLAVDGRCGVLFERLVGPSLLRRVAARPWTILRAVRTFTDLHLAMHAREIVVSDLPSQREHLARQITDAPLVPDAVRAAALRRLEQLPEGRFLCHGDYHPDNVLVTPRGPIIIDWGTASRGHPLADVSRTELLLQIGEPPVLPSGVQLRLLACARAYVRRAYVRRYLRRSSSRAAELADWHLPVAVARLAEEIPGERSRLLRFILSLRRGYP